MTTVLVLRQFLVIAAFAATTSAALAAGPAHGVTDTEILVGTITDLSGVTAVQGVNSADAIRLAFDDANAKGGINGRKIRYIVEDSQYQVPRAVQASKRGKSVGNPSFFPCADSVRPTLCIMCRRPPPFPR